MLEVKVKCLMSSDTWNTVQHLCLFVHNQGTLLLSQFGPLLLILFNFLPLAPFSPFSLLLFLFFCSFLNFFLAPGFFPCSMLLFRIFLCSILLFLSFLVLLAPGLSFGCSLLLNLFYGLLLAPLCQIGKLKVCLK